MRTWFRHLRTAPGTRRAPSQRAHLCLEALESRCVPAGNVLQTNLVSDLPGVAATLDPNLVNPWGISASPTLEFWVSDNGAGVTTLYDTNGQPVPITKTQTQNFATIPSPTDPTGGGTPTGTVFNSALGSGAFPVSNGTNSAASIFLFVTEDGTIVGWNPSINPANSDPSKAGTFGIIAKDNSASGAVYKGMAIASGSSPIFSGDQNSNAVIYVANFHSGRIEVYDSAFNQVTLPTGAFNDPNLPKGFAPFDVQALNGKIYVTYAKQDADKHDDVAGPGNGFVDVYNLDGSPGLANNQVRLISRGALNSPWGLAIAPTNFAGITNPSGNPVLLVGNFGDGLIHAYDANTGKFLTTLKDPDGEPVQIDGLWGLRVGNGGQGGDANTVYFTAGLDHEAHGLFGSLATATPGSPEGQAEAQKVTAALDIVLLDVSAVQNDLATGASKTQLKQDLKTLRVDLHKLVHLEKAFNRDALADALSGRNGMHGANHGKNDNNFLDLFFAQFHM